MYVSTLALLFTKSANACKEFSQKTQNSQNLKIEKPIYRQEKIITNIKYKIGKNTKLFDVIRLFDLTKDNWHFRLSLGPS